MSLTIRAYKGKEKGNLRGNVWLVTEYGEQRHPCMKGGLVPRKDWVTTLSPEETGRTCISGSAACSYKLSGICGQDYPCRPGCPTAPAREIAQRAATSPPIGSSAPAGSAGPQPHVPRSAPAWNGKSTQAAPGYPRNEPYSHGRPTAGLAPN